MNKEIAKMQKLAMLVKEYLKDAQDYQTMNTVYEDDKTGWENYSDDDLLKNYEDYERRKYDLGLQAAKDFIYLKKELAKRNLKKIVDDQSKIQEMNKEIAKMQKLAGLLKENLEEGSGSQAEKLEGLLSNLTRNVSTDSNISTASKEGLLNAFNEMMDIVQDILGSEEADSFYDEDEDDDYGSDNPEDGYGPRMQ